MKVRFLLLLSVLIVGTVTGCKKNPTNEGGNENGGTPDAPLHFDEDLSFTRTLERCYVAHHGLSLAEYKILQQYDGNKEIGYQRYIDGVLNMEYKNIVYSGLTRTLNYCAYGGSTLESEWYQEFLDDSYTRQTYGETRTDAGVIAKTIFEYDGKKCIGVVGYSRDILVQKSFDYHWGDRMYTYTTNNYSSNDGSLQSVSQYLAEYSDTSYTCPVHTKQIITYYSTGNERVDTLEYYYQRDGRKITGMQYYRNGVLLEENKGCVYDGNKCTYTQVLYDNEGQIVYEGEAYTIYYNP